MKESLILLHNGIVIIKVNVLILQKQVLGGRMT